MSIIDIHFAGLKNAEAHPGDHGNHIVWRHEMPGGAQLLIVQMIFNARIIEAHDETLTLGRGWCYRSDTAAALAAAKWIAGGCEGEPGGWIKNLQTGEYHDD